MNPKLMENYSVFYEMVLISTALSNSLGNEADEDQRKIIELIGKANGMDEGMIEDCQKTIIDDLASIGTETDINAFTSLCQDGVIPHIEQGFYRVKVDAIHALQSIVSQKPFGANDEWFSYRERKTYFPSIRYKEMLETAKSGVLLCNKVVALMAAAGIGTSKNIEGALYRLKQCAFWGDTGSFALIAFLYEQKGDETEGKTYRELVSLTPYLEEGRTMLPEKEKLSEETTQLYALISSIRHDIVLKDDLRKIDYSFVEVMMLENVDYFQKMKYINGYQKAEWKEVSNPTNNPNKHFGFYVGGKK